MAPTNGARAAHPEHGGEKIVPAGKLEGQSKPTNSKTQGASWLNNDQRWRAIKAHIAKGDKANDKAEQHYIAAGLHLTTLKKLHDAVGGTWAEWEQLLKTTIGIGKSRASELMQIADGRKSVEQVRADSTERKANERKRISLRDVTESTPDLEAAAEAADSAEPITAKFAAADAVAEKLRAAEIKIMGLEAELEALKHQNAELRRQLEAANGRKDAAAALTLVTPSPDDGLEIPTFLIRGHPDCPFGTSKSATPRPRSPASCGGCSTRRWSAL
jgi:hypothetical protein